MKWWKAWYNYNRGQERKQEWLFAIWPGICFKGWHRRWRKWEPVCGRCWRYAIKISQCNLKMVVWSAHRVEAVWSPTRHVEEGSVQPVKARHQVTRLILVKFAWNGQATLTGCFQLAIPIESIVTFSLYFQAQCTVKLLYNETLCNGKFVNENTDQGSYNLKLFSLPRSLNVLHCHFYLLHCWNQHGKRWK